MNSQCAASARGVLLKGRPSSVVAVLSETSD